MEAGIYDFSVKVSFTDIRARALGLEGAVGTKLNIVPNVLALLQ